MLDTHAHWPSGIRDTTEFPKVDICIDTSFREHLAAFLKLDGIGWNDYDDQRTISGQTVADSRMRTNRKMYERMGVIYKDNDKIRLSRLGSQMKNLESNLNEAKELILSDVRATAVDILSRYQLKNPVDGPDLPSSCDVLPCVCIWKAMRELDNKIGYEEMNRVILHVMEMSQLDEAIQIIRSARMKYNSYSDLDEITLNSVLGTPVHTDQPTARIAPWFSFAGWGGLVIEQNADDNGFRYLNEKTLPQIDAIIDKTYPYFETDDKDEWLRYYIGSAAEFSEEAVEPINGTKQEIDESTRPTTGIDGLNYRTNIVSVFPRNRIVFGAPGTGKSFSLNNDRNTLLGTNTDDFERVTFHPEYSYSQFVGCYKPLTDDDGNIRYEFVPGPFMRILVAALSSGRTETPQPFLLLIEEINRAKVAAVFGEVFQLLDRNDQGYSQYEIHATEDMKQYLAKKLGGVPDNYTSIRIPDNMFIWATMNSADQGVFPMDTAFKRRWDFEYIGIDDNDATVGGLVEIGKDTHKQLIDWNLLRKSINEKLAVEFHVNEDKLMGPFFLSKSVFDYDTDTKQMKNPDAFKKAFKSKVLMYLYEDAAKPCKHQLFSGCDSSRYSSVCTAFDETGLEIFGTDFQALYDRIKGA